MDEFAIKKPSSPAYSYKSLELVWGRPKSKPIDFKEFCSRFLNESGIDIDRRNTTQLRLRHATRKAKGIPTIVCDGLFYAEFVEYFENDPLAHLRPNKLGHWIDFQAALCHHPRAVFRTIEYAREYLLGGSDIDGLGKREFQNLEQAWLIKAALEEPWLADYMETEDSIALVFHARLRLAELCRGTSKERHYIELARELCRDSDEGQLRQDILARKIKELATIQRTTSTVVICPRPFAEREAASERDVNQLNHYAELLKPLPIACVERPVESIKAALNAQYPWMANVTQHFIEQLQIQILLGNHHISLRPTLLVGAPGIGKNHYLNMFAKELGLPSQLIAIGGSSDNRALAGTSRGYGNGRPSQILTAIVERKVVNPLVILDEIEKESTGSHNGRVSDTLHQLLEKENARHWHDEFLLTECDLSWVNWIACANSLAGLSDSLLSRFEVVRVSRPAPDDMYAVVYGVIKDIAVRNKQPLVIMPKLTPDCWNLLEDCFERGHSPRMVAKVTERLVAALLVSESGLCAH